MLAPILALLLSVVAEASARPEHAEALARIERARLARPAALIREALAAEGRGEHDEAMRLLGEVSRRHPIVGDHADLLRARALLDRDDTSAAAVALLEALQRYKESPLRSQYYQLLGSARERFGDEEGARSAWQSALDETSDDELKAELQRAIGASLERSGKQRDAAAAYAVVWKTYPTSSSASRSDERLVALEGQLGESFRDASSWRRRGDKLFRSRDNPGALAAYDTALALGLEGSEGRRTQQQRGYTLFRLRRYDEAVAGFAVLPQEHDVRLWHARSLARDGQVPRAIREFERLADDSRGSLGIRSRFLAGILLEGQGQGERARGYFNRVAASKASPNLATAALWRLGWSQYQNGEKRSSSELFDRLTRREEDPIGRLRARYWRARALEGEEPETARLEFEAIAREFPFTYYGWRARGRLPAGSVAIPAGGTLSRGRTALSPTALARPRILLEAGLGDESVAELERVARKARSLSERLELAQLATDAGNYHRAQRLIIDAYIEPLARGPIPSMEEVWWYAWPAAYSEWVGPATAKPGSVDEDLVFSIMREESGYRPAVVSVSGARGLLQIMETTGSRLARDSGRQSFSVEDLFQPRTNIGLGSFYLAELSRRFPDRIAAAIASYNAGPTAVSRWVRARGELADDEWVESIPYDQTRSYVKRVLRSLYAYQVLY